MNNAARRLGQYYSAYWLERLGGRVQGGRVLEVGCGCGTGVRIILERFGATAVEALDLDPKMIDRARRRLARYGLDRVQLSVGDATAIKAGDATFDAVFDFGAIHLEPNWRKALAEVRRVLKPGGRFFLEWVTNSVLRLPYPLVTEAFGRLEPPSPGLLMQELEREGIMVGRSFVCPRIAALTGFVGDLVGVGQVAEATHGSSLPDA